MNGHKEDVNAADISPDGKTLASGSYDSTIKLWNLNTLAEIKTLPGHGGGVFSVNFSPDGKTLSSGGYDKTIKLWNLETLAETMTFSGHGD